MICLVIGKSFLIKTLYDTYIDKIQLFWYNYQVESGKKRIHGMMRRLAIYILLLCACCGYVSGEIINVPLEYSNIQSAIVDANNGDTIIVAQGIYYENINFLGKAITLSSTDPNDPCVVANTIIDGSQPNDVNIGSVVTFNSGEDQNSVLTGFTITGGTGQTDPTVTWRTWTGTNGDGGGIFCYNSSPTISKNIITNCTTNYGGGGIYCHYYASPVITNNQIINNCAEWYGGAIFTRYYCSPLIKDNVLEGNSCSYLGGGIYLATGSNSNIINNLIKNNICTSLAGGGIYYFVMCHPIIANNVIIGNSAESGGSAIMAESDSNGYIINNTIIGNKITQPSGFSSTLAIYTNPIIANNIVADNQCWGIYTGIDSDANLVNNDLWGNSYGNYHGNLPDQTSIKGNISADPNLAPTLPYPLPSYELTYDSPCRDTGSNDYNSILNEYDYDLTSRIVNGTVDIGAQEFRALSVPQDYPTIQQAINNAQTGDEILVHEGFYQENINFTGKNLILRSLNPLDPCCVTQTVIDGNQLSSCITLNSYEDKTSVIAGFTIQNGFGHALDKEFGGGIYIADYAGATIIFNHIRNNVVTRYGGGIDTRHHTDTVIMYNDIEFNHAYNAGGGIHVGAQAKCLIKHNSIHDNKTNFARQGGGIYVYNWSDVSILKNDIFNNYSSSGGGIYEWKGVGEISRNNIWNNYATAIGGGIAIHSTYLEPFSIVNINNNLIEGNCTSGRGGGIFLLQGSTIVNSNTIVGNKLIRSASDPNTGSGITLEAGAYADIKSNIIANNIGGSGIHVESTTPPNLLIDPNISFNDIWNNENGNYTGINYAGHAIDRTGLNGNISSDPCFVNNGYWADNDTPSDSNDDYWIRGHYKIGYYSPCVDSGDPNNVNQIDLTGKPRPHFEGTDIGAYELQIYDLTTTGTVDYSDLEILLNYWLFNSVYDLDGDNIINWLDYTLLISGWNK